MKRNDFRKYLAYVKEQRHITIEEYYLEKDYFISSFLSMWQQLRDEGNIPHLDSLIFKGGTLLARNYLNYPRISEDLDFTHKDSNNLRTIKTTGRRETQIRNRIIPIIDDIKHICDAVNFDFKTDRTNERYIQVRNSRAVYVFYLYYSSLITGEQIPIKIEVNLLDHIIYDSSDETLRNIIDQDTFLKSIGYDLTNRTMKTYALDEIILEKYRAILTRKALKERDILDLYLIHQKGTDVFKAGNKLIDKKIQSGILISPDLEKNLEKNRQLLQKNSFGESNDDINRLTLVEIDDKDYEKFKDQLYKKLKDICNMRI